MKQNLTIAVLGLGEAGSRFANDLAGLGLSVFGSNPNPIYSLHDSVHFANSNADAAKEADIILSVNLSTVSEEVAKEVFPVLHHGKIYCEMNTSSPNKKQTVNEILKPSGV